MTRPRHGMPSELPPAPSPLRPGPSLATLLGIDRRSLAAFRIGLGLMLLLDLYGREIGRASCRERV